jgi:hypothetical protein
MTLIRKAALACVASALLALPVNAMAQGPANQDTFFTFSQSVELPGKTLPAGKYFFQLADSPSNRHIVKVMSEDRKQLHATLMAIPFYTNDRPSDEPQVRFMETPSQAGNGSSAAPTTNAIKIWFYPGNSVGHEFIYPRSQAMQIASRTGQPVLTTKTEAEMTADSELTRVDRAGADTAVDMSNRSNTQQTTTAQTSTTETQTAQTQSAQTQPQSATADTRTTATQTTTAQAERTTQPAQNDRMTQSTAQTDRAQSTADTTADRTAQQPMTDRSADRAADTTRTDLPNTAGLLPLLAVIGLGSLVGSRLLRRSRRV